MENVSAEGMVAANVRRVRELRDMRQADLARLLGVSTATVSKLESGDRRITVDDLVQLAAALSVAPAWLLVPWDAEDPELVIELRGGKQAVYPGSPVEAQQWVVGEEPLFDDPRDYFWTVPRDQRHRRNAILKEWERDGRVSFPDPHTVVFRSGVTRTTYEVPEED